MEIIKGRNASGVTSFLMLLILIGKYSHGMTHELCQSLTKLIDILGEAFIVYVHLTKSFEGFWGIVPDLIQVNVPLFNLALYLGRFGCCVANGTLIV